MLYPLSYGRMRTDRPQCITHDNAAYGVDAAFATRTCTSMRV